MNETERDYTELITKAKELGFVPLEGNVGRFFKHPLINDVTFDFSAIDPEKLLLALWQRGIKQGKRLKAKAIVDELDLWGLVKETEF